MKTDLQTYATLVKADPFAEHRELLAIVPRREGAFIILRDMTRANFHAYSTHLVYTEQHDGGGESLHIVSGTYDHSPKQAAIILAERLTDHWSQ